MLIERQIRQLKAAGIDGISVVVGYRKKEFFYMVIIGAIVAATHMKELFSKKQKPIELLSS